MGEAVIVAGCRTAVGTAGRGTLVDVDAFELGAHVVRALVDRVDIASDDIDDIVLGETLQGGGDIARYVAADLGLVHVPGVALNRHCASSLSAIQTAAASIRAGMDRVVIAGGSHSISTFPLTRRRVLGSDEWEDWWSPSHPDSPSAPNMDMSITVGWNAARLAGVTREEMDAWALASHQRAIAGIDAGAFEEEIVPLEVRRRDGSITTFAVDEHPRRDTSMEKLAALRPVHPEIEGFSITGGNSSGGNDGAAAVLVVDDSYADDHGLDPIAVVRSWANVGVDPTETGLAPTKAIPKALERAGLRLEDVELFEINEAFASMCVASTRILGIPHERTNVLGSGCSLGHPIAATGARMVVTLIHELRRRGGGIGVAAMCAGGGMGSAIVLDVPAAG